MPPGPHAPEPVCLLPPGPNLHPPIAPPLTGPQARAHDLPSPHAHVCMLQMNAGASDPNPQAPAGSLSETLDAAKDAAREAGAKVGLL